MAEVVLRVKTEDPDSQRVFKAMEANGKSAFDAVKSAGVESSTKVSSAWETLKSNWIGITAAIAAAWASLSWARDAIKDAHEAEVAYNKLKIQIEGMGLAYSSVSAKVQQAIDKTAAYARVQDEDVAKSLQNLVFLTGNLEGSMKNLNLVYDLAYQKSISHEEAAMLIGKAMSGNVEMLGRYIPELHNLEKALGANATEAQKTAYAMSVLEAKTLGASEKMTDHEKKVQSLTKLYQDWKKIIGGGLAAAIDKVGPMLEYFVKSQWYGGETASLMAQANEQLIATEKLHAEVLKESSAATETKSAALAAQIKITNDTITILTAYTKALQAADDGLLKIADENYTTRLGHQKETFDQINVALKGQVLSLDGVKTASAAYQVALGGMNTSLAGYLGTIDAVYTKQLDLNKALLVDLQKKGGADPEALKAVKDQQQAVLGIETAYAQARLGAWTSYYNTIKGLHTQALDAMKVKTQELKDLEDRIMTQRQGYAALMAQLNVKIWGDASNEVDKYYVRQQDLDRQLSSALALSGQKKIDALEKYMQDSAAAAVEVKQDGQEYISLQTASITALNRVNDAQQTIVATQNDLKAAKAAEVAAEAAWAETLQTAMTKAATQMDAYKGQIIDVGNRMSALQMIVDNTQAQQAIANVKSQIDNYHPVTYWTIIQTVGGSGGTTDTGGSSFDSGGSIGTFASGTRYVPKTGVYQLHQGEQVQNRSEVNNNKTTVTINMPPITVNAQTNEDPEALAARIVRPIRRKLQELNYVS